MYLDRSATIVYDREYVEVSWSLLSMLRINVVQTVERGYLPSNSIAGV